MERGGTLQLLLLKEGPESFPPFSFASACLKTISEDIFCFSFYCAVFFRSFFPEMFCFFVFTKGGLTELFKPVGFLDRFCFSL